GLCAGLLRPGRAGCVTLRLRGATLGAVRVDGGGENVREPRLPVLNPPPTRASAVPASIPSVATTATTGTSLRRKERIIGNLPSPPGSGRAIIRGMMWGDGARLEGGLAPPEPGSVLARNRVRQALAVVVVGARQHGMRRLVVAMPSDGARAP